MKPWFFSISFFLFSLTVRANLCALTFDPKFPPNPLNNIVTLKGNTYVIDPKENGVIEWIHVENENDAVKYIRNHQIPILPIRHWLKRAQESHFSAIGFVFDNFPEELNKDVNAFQIREKDIPNVSTKILKRALQYQKEYNNGDREDPHYFLSELSDLLAARILTTTWNEAEKIAEHLAEKGENSKTSSFPVEVSLVLRDKDPKNKNPYENSGIRFYRVRVQFNDPKHHDQTEEVLSYEFQITSHSMGQFMSWEHQRIYKPKKEVIEKRKADFLIRQKTDPTFEEISYEDYEKRLEEKAKLIARTIRFKEDRYLNLLKIIENLEKKEASKKRDKVLQRHKAHLNRLRISQSNPKLPDQSDLLKIDRFEIK
ncbi:MAG: hypothetical protein CL678_06860 [Bdellovibrionaceae bacterium]|nr:hypothetical protein [Pseudobdellovibrionaceae bacterium]|tara:strand:- start:2683 stop:3792 length:1110 start_codon:yes stop_codon:yes gene_type:complete